MDEQSTVRLLTRRQVLGGMAAGGLAIGAGGLIAACSTPTGSPSSNAPSTGGASALPSSSAETGGFKRGGTLRVGVSGGSAKDSIDVHKWSGDVDISRLSNLYEPLFEHDENFVLQNVLAESLEPVAADDWIIHLRTGVVFHDGKAFGADDVIYSLRRLADPDDPKTGAGRVKDIDFDRLEKVDDHTVRIRLVTPNVAFPELISDVYALMGPVDFDPAKPVGTGPFKLKSFTPGSQSEFVRNEDYWQEGLPFLDSLVILDMPEQASRLNALIGGQVEAITHISATEVPIVEGAGQSVLQSKGVRWTPLTMRVDVAPFNDVRVRQAMRLAVNRQQMIDQALSGYGILGNDMYAPYDAGYPKSLPQREQDIDQAKALLREAGQTDLRVELIAAEIGTGAMAAAQVLVEQVKAAGITVSLRKVESSALYGDEYKQWPFAMDTWGMNSFLPQVVSGSLPTAPYNTTHWDDEEFAELAMKAQVELNEATRNELIGKALTIEYERGGNLIWSFNDQLDAFSSAVAGFVPHKRGYPLSYYGFKSVAFIV
jgi:peptide/nickel transport system substrate-binding protein